METLEAPTDVGRFTSETESREIDARESAQLSLDGTMDVNHRLAIQRASFSGPLPAPPILAQYDHVVPGLARELVDQWKGETRHRQETVTGLRQTDHEAMVRYYEAEKRGQRFGLLAILGILAIATMGMVLDRPAIGVTSLLTGGAAAIWAMRRRSGGPAWAPVELDQGDNLTGR